MKKMLALFICIIFFISVMPTEAHAGWWSKNYKSFKKKVTSTKTYKSVTKTYRSIKKTVSKPKNTATKSVSSTRTTPTKSVSRTGSSSYSSSGHSSTPVITHHTPNTNNPLNLPTKRTSLKDSIISMSARISSFFSGLFGSDKSTVEDTSEHNVPVLPNQNVPVVAQPVVKPAGSTGNALRELNVGGGSSGGSGGTTTPTITDDTPPAISYNVSGTMGENGWFIGDVLIEIIATDDDELYSVTYSMDNGKTLKNYDHKKKPPINLSQSGQYNFSTTAMDVSGNYRIGALNTKNMKKIGNPSNELIANNLDSLNKFLEKNHIKAPEDLKK